MNSEFNEFAMRGKLMKKEESKEIKIKGFGIIIKEISYFQNQQLFGLKFGENE